jgi:PTH1 family peptidyl-tRNA hydrolase
MYLIVGLGNPGTKYDNTYHNVGFRMLDSFNERIKKIKHRGFTGKSKLFGEDVLFVKPQTYMNLSGECVAPLAKYYKVPPENIIVIYDDVYLDLGTVRTRLNGSDGGHKGMKSIIKHLGTNQFPRIRIGVGKVPEDELIVEYVLQNMAEDEIQTINSCFEKVLEGIKHIVSENSRRNQ